MKYKIVLWLIHRVIAKSTSTDESFTKVPNPGNVLNVLSRTNLDFSVSLKNFL